MIDSAHTLRSALALAKALESIAPRGFDLVLSVSRDKDLRGVLEPLLVGARRIWATRAEPTRSLVARDLAERLMEWAPGVEVLAVESPEEALRRARDELTDDGILCATGSIYLAGIARRILGGESPTRT